MCKWRFVGWAHGIGIIFLLDSLIVFLPDVGRRFLLQFQQKKRVHVKKRLRFFDTVVTPAAVFGSGHRTRHRSLLFVSHEIMTVFSRQLRKLVGPPETWNWLPGMKPSPWSEWNSVTCKPSKGACRAGHRGVGHKWRVPSFFRGRGFSLFWPWTNRWKWWEWFGVLSSCCSTVHFCVSFVSPSIFWKFAEPATFVEQIVQSCCRYENLKQTKPNGTRKLRQ